MSKKKVLYYMPDNPLKGKGGNLTRCNQMLTYFQKNCNTLDVTFIFSMDWDEESEQAFNLKYPDLNLKIFQFKMSKSNLFKYLINDKIPKELNKAFNKNTLDLTTPYFRGLFKKEIQDNHYDIVMISYSTWGNIIDDIQGPYFILDTHDFMTLQYKINYEDRLDFDIGKLFQNEMNVLKKYNEIWTYSIEEQYIFDQFTNSNVKLVPVSFPVNSKDLAAPIKYSVLYVASDNQHNVNSIQWFINRVLPLLGNVKIYIVGKICSKIQDEENIVKLGPVNDLDAIYKQSKITICPMLTGTGVKIKVLESLSYGLPVVTTRRGVDGLVNKSQNGCLIANEEKEFARYILKLLSDEIFYTQHQIEARSYFEKHHHPELETKFLDKIFMEV